MIIEFSASQRQCLVVDTFGNVLLLRGLIKPSTPMLEASKEHLLNVGPQRDKVAEFVLGLMEAKGLSLI